MTLLGALTSDQRFGAGLLAHCWLGAHRGTSLAYPHW